MHLYNEIPALAWRGKKEADVILPLELFPILNQMIS